MDPSRGGLPIALHEETSDFVARAVAALDDKKGIDVLVLDVSTLIVVTDAFVIVSGTSRPHIQSLAEGVEEALRAVDRRPLRREGADETRWVLLDYGDFVVHLFDQDTREYYALARLWSDAPRVEFPLGVVAE